MKKNLYFKNHQIEAEKINYVNFVCNIGSFCMKERANFNIKLNREDISDLKNVLQAQLGFVLVDTKAINPENVVAAEMVGNENPSLMIKFKNQSLKISNANASDFNAIVQAMEAREAFMC